MKFIIIVAAVLGLAWAAPEVGFESRNVRGEIAKPGQFPYQVSNFNNLFT